MITSADPVLRAQVIADEGWRAYVYDDANGAPIMPGSMVIGHPTIGYGFCVEKGRGELPPRIAEDWLTEILDARIQDLRVHLAWFDDLDVVRQRVLVNLSFQLGLTGLLQFRQMLAHLKAGHYARAAAALLDSKLAREDAPARTARHARVLETGVDA